MGKKIRKKVVPKEAAVFWLDKNGHWHNQYGKFEHRRIIDYFHSSIKRDRGGYYLYQATESCQEKVYFHYEDQALFVFDVVRDNDVTLVLNTKKKIVLRPKKLFVKNDSLYMQLKDETLKFAEQGLLKISPLLENENDQLYIRVKKRKYKIRTLHQNGSPNGKGTN
jgi:hypothetical protein